MCQHRGTKQVFPKCPGLRTLRTDTVEVLGHREVIISTIHFVTDANGGLKPKCSFDVLRGVLGKILEGWYKTLGFAFD